MGVLMVALVGLSLLTQWEMQDIVGTLRRSWVSLLAAALLTAMAVVLGVRDISMVVFAFTSFFALAVNIEVAANTIKGDPRFLGGKLAHIGLAIFFLGVISTGRYSESQQIALPKGSPQEAVGHRLTYTGSDRLPDGKFAYRVRVEGEGRNFELSPVMFQAGEQGVMRNPDIKSFLTRDIYISPLSLEKPQITGEAESFWSILRPSYARQPICRKGGVIPGGDSMRSRLLR